MRHLKVGVILVTHKRGLVELMDQQFGVAWNLGQSVVEAARGVERQAKGGACHHAPRRTPLRRRVRWHEGGMRLTAGDVGRR